MKLLKTVVELIGIAIVALGVFVFMLLGGVAGILSWTFDKLHLLCKITYAMILMLKFDIIIHLPFIRRWYMKWKRWFRIKYISFKKGN